MFHSVSHAQELGSELPTTSIGFEGLVSTPSCAVTFNGQSNGTFTLRMPALSSDFFLTNQASAISRFNIDIAVAPGNEQPLTQAQQLCTALLNSGAFKIQFDVDTNVLTDSGKLKNALPAGSGSNVLVEVISFNDSSANFQVLNLRQSKVLNLISTSTGGSAKSTQLQLGVRYVKDQQSNQDVQVGGFAAYLPFLLKYE